MKLVIRYIGIPGGLLGDELALSAATGMGTSNFVIAVISATLVIVYEIVA